MTDLLRSPLHDRHVTLGAKLADFGGWEMPIEYASTGGGVLKEHAAVREAVGLFDVSHLGKASVTGPGARAFVNGCLSNDLDRIGPGQAQYTLCCDTEGGVVDDLIAYLVSDDEVFLVPNAANTGEVVRRLQAATPAGVEVVDRHLAFGVLAVQGPRSADVLEQVGLPSGLDYMSWTDAEWDGAARARVPHRLHRRARVRAAAGSRRRRAAVGRAARGRRATLGGLPAGLGARDTLRTEMGYPLHGQDLSLDISPVQARSGWAVGWRKDAFWGRDALLAEKNAGPERTLRGLRGRGPRASRAPTCRCSPATPPSARSRAGRSHRSRRVGIGLALISDRRRGRGRRRAGTRRARPAQPRSGGAAAVRALARALRARRRSSSVDRRRVLVSGVAAAASSSSAAASTASPLTERRCCTGKLESSTGRAGRSRRAATVELRKATNGTASSAPTMPARMVPVSTDSAIASGWTSTLRLMISGCSRCASSCTSTMIAMATTTAAVKPCSSRATATHSAPVTVSPTSGMNEPEEDQHAQRGGKRNLQDQQHDRHRHAVEDGDQHLATHVAAEGPPADARGAVEPVLRAAGEQSQRPAPDGVAVAQQEERRQQHQQERAEELGDRPARCRWRR